MTNDLREGRKNRSSNYELLRILMMLSLIAHHLTVNSGMVELWDDSAYTVIAQVFGMWGKTAINVFTLITGFFMIKKQLRIEKVLQIVLEIYFYVFAYYIIFLLSGYEPFSLKGFVETILFVPWEMGRYYGGSMVMMLLLIPIVNKGISALSKKQYQVLLCLLLFYYTVLSSIHFYDNFDFVIWMLTVYLIGGYVSLYKVSIDKISVGIIGGGISIVLMIASIIGMTMFLHKVDKAYFFVNDANKVLALTTSVFVFIIFKNLRIKNSKLINSAASTTFGILLLHACCPGIRRLLWVDLFDIVGHYDKSYFMFIYFSGVVLIVFVVAMFIDLLRQRFIEKPFFSFLETRYSNLMKKNLWE